MPRLWCSLLIALLPGIAFGADTSVDIGKIEGVYRRSFQNGDSSGEKYISTDVLEIVRVEKGVAYFSVELHFFNGHMCELSGIAVREKGALVHRDNERPDEPCEFHLVPKRGRITFEDIHGHCRRNCGARGSFFDATFRIARRNTTNLKRLRASPGYRAAVDEYRKSKKEKP
jgi:hypothetical protein